MAVSAIPSGFGASSLPGFGSAMNRAGTQRVRVVDSHTGGEPTRVVVDGGPELGAGSLSDRRLRFQSHHDHFRSAVINEPRGSEVLVGALLVEPEDSSCTAGVIFFNSVGPLGMCGHGTIGLIRTLEHLGRLRPGDHRIETPVGIVSARLHEDGAVSVRNVPCYRLCRGVKVEVPEEGPIAGDVAWGGNWFYLVAEHGRQLSIARVEELTRFTVKVRSALAAAGITGADGHEIDHVELFAPSPDPTADSRNFVLCPGHAYDRSPCGTGTSAKLACLFADGKLSEGQIWRQESITGSIFEGSIEREGDLVLPTIKGDAWVTAESTLLLDPSDPLCWGIRSQAQR